MPRTILHIDLDAFFCAVEENQNPVLRGKAFAVGGKPEERGVVASCSYAARRMGVRSAMPMSRAIRLCPGLVIVPSRHGLYSEVSRQVMGILRAQTPLVEQISIDEAFLDISDSQQEPERFGRGLQTRVRDELHLPCSLGIASNKLMAKLATEVGKALALQKIKAEGLVEPPNAVTVVGFGEEAAFLDARADAVGGTDDRLDAAELEGETERPAVEPVGSQRAGRGADLPQAGGGFDVCLGVFGGDRQGAGIALDFQRLRG